MMVQQKVSQRYAVKLPPYTSVVYYKQKKIVLLVGVLNKKYLKLNTQIILNYANKSIEVTSLPFYTCSLNKQRQMKTVQGTTAALLKQHIIESSLIFYQKLKIVGVGYWVVKVKSFEKDIFMFKLGYSHHIYFKFSVESKVFCLKMTQFLVYSDSYQKTTRTASIIWSYWKPEPYKGKGILFDEERVALKEGKKV